MDRSGVSTPRAVVADELGPVENYSLRPRDLPPPGPREVRVAIRAIGVSYADVLMALGRYQVRPDPPFVPGSECSGVIEALGAEVTGLSVGQKVIATSMAGMFAEAVNTPATSVRRIPEGLSFEEGAVLLTSYLTSLYALVNRGRLQAGESLLVLGAGGGTGFAAVQIGVHLGARVIASASTPAKRELALKAGAAAAVDSRASDWREAVRAANGGKAIDVVYDPIGGEFTERAFRTLAYDGRHLVVGFVAGIPSLPTNLALLKTGSLIGVNLGTHAPNRPHEAEANRAKVIELAQMGVLRPVIAKTLPIEAYAEAMAEVAQGESAGRIVMTT